jgi:hypothetical protein
MKFIFVILLIISNNAFGQDRPEDNPLFNGERKFAGGLVLGGNASQVDGDYLNGYHKFGLNAGAIAYVNFGKRTAISLELLFSQKGSYSVTTNESPYFGTYFAKYSIHLNYAEVPLLFHFYASPRFHFGIGASYNVLAGSKEMYNDASFNVVIDPEVYSFSRHTFDGIVGGSVVLWRGLMFDIRYQYSLTTIRKLQNIPAGLGFENQKNNMFALRLIYLF